MARTIFERVNIASCDPAASIAFYRRLGVEIPEPSVWRMKTGIHHASALIAAEGAAELDIDSAAFAQLWNTGWRGRSDLAGRVVVGFKLATRETVEVAYAEATGTGHKGLQPPYDAFWGARYAMVEDPDGIAAGLMSPIDPARKTAPPEV